MWKQESKRQFWLRYHLLSSLNTNLMQPVLCCFSPLLDSSGFMHYVNPLKVRVKV